LLLRSRLFCYACGVFRRGTFMAEAFWKGAHDTRGTCFTPYSKSSKALIWPVFG
jgi:hypothetical protein